MRCVAARHSSSVRSLNVCQRERPVSVADHAGGAPAVPKYEVSEILQPLIARGCLDSGKDARRISLDPKPEGLWRSGWGRGSGR